ncbi:hypothetical protein C8T65DRAFT_646305 [Cerioporus squamosus]|nr:hypothetical protein C8T65DRAFT_646305 [Cerioporus squamosus]
MPFHRATRLCSLLVTNRASAFSGWYTTVDEVQDDHGYQVDGRRSTRDLISVCHGLPWCTWLRVSRSNLCFSGKLVVIPSYGVRARRHL